MRIAPLRWTPSSHKYPLATSGIVVLLLTSAIVISGISGESPGKVDYRRQSIDDDEIHDEEILQAVVQSLNQWQQRRQDKVHSNSTTNVTHHRVKRDEEIVCYGELGCFRDEGPFDYLDMLPSPPEEIGTKFLLFTRQNRQVAEVFSYFNFTSMYGSHFNASLPTKVIIHGFGSTCNRIWASEMRLALLSVVECNVICVDWENGAAMPNYVRAAVNTRLVGKQVALLILWLNDHVGSRTQDYHLVGFSLGAHVAGFAGQELKNLSRITGLDPAGPLFESYDSKVRLDTEDALFVDVIHSNGDSLLMGGLGSWEPMGHVDFYPNGGRVQKGCSNLFLGAVRDFLWSASDGDGRSLCNHRRAYKFFTESVSPRCPFPAFSCDSYDKFLTGSCFTWDVQHCGNMGYYADQLPHGKKGILYLVTREDEPFCANQFRITIESSPSPAPVITYGGLESILIGHDFINETFLVTQTVKDNMVAGSVLQRLVVAHPALADPAKVQLKYTAYNGWLYSGISRWSMDRLIITNAYGKSWSFCSRGLLLPSGIPVTVTLSPGVCINGYPGGNGLMSPSRPMYPQYPYENYPTQPSDNNALQTSQHGTENNTIASTNLPGKNNYGPMEMNTDLDIDTSMKPPPVVTVPNANPQDEIGPTYQLQATEVDWSQWQPLSPSPALLAGMSNNNHNNLNNNNNNNINNPNKENTIHDNFHENKFAYSGGTPVETYPPVIIDEYDEDPTLQQSAVMADMENMTASPGEEDATESEIVPTEVPDMQGANTSTENTSSNTTVTMSERVKIRICHMVPSLGNGSFHGDSNDFGESRKLTCVDTPANSASQVIHPLPILTDLEDKDTITTNELRANANPDEAISPTAENPEAIRNELLNSIPVPPQSFWTAMQHNNTPNAMSQHQGEDPDVVLPPHLQYILQQLDSQGFGPKSTSMQNNFRHHGNKNRGLIPSSRALKPRPVFLSSRRQAKTIDAPIAPMGNSPNNQNNNNLNHNNNNHNNNNHNLNGPPKLIGGSMMGPILGPNPHSGHHLLDGRFGSPQQPLIHGHHVTVVGPPPQLQPQMASSHGIPSIIVAPIVHGESNKRSFARRLPGPPPILPAPMQVPNRPTHGHNSASPQLPPQSVSPIQMSKTGMGNGHNQNVHGNSLQNHGHGPGMHLNAQPGASFVTKHKGGYYFLPYYAFDRPAMLIPRRVVGANRRPLPSPPPSPGHLIQLPPVNVGGSHNNHVKAHSVNVVNTHNSNVVNPHNSNVVNPHNNNLVNSHNTNSNNVNAHSGNIVNGQNTNVANNHNHKIVNNQNNNVGNNHNNHNNIVNGHSNNIANGHNSVTNSNIANGHNNINNGHNSVANSNMANGHNNINNGHNSVANSNMANGHNNINNGHNSVANSNMANGHNSANNNMLTGRGINVGNNMPHGQSNNIANNNMSNDQNHNGINNNVATGLHSNPVYSSMANGHSNSGANNNFATSAKNPAISINANNHSHNNNVVNSNGNAAGKNTYSSHGNVVNNHNNNLAASQNHHVASNHNNNVGSNHNNNVGSNHNNNVGNNHNNNVGNNHNNNVGNSHNNNVGNNHNNNVGSNHNNNVASNHNSNVGNNHNSNVASNHNSNVGGNHNNNVASNHNSNVGYNHINNVASNHNSNVASNHNVATIHNNVVTSHNSNVESSHNINTVSGHTGHSTNNVVKDNVENNNNNSVNSKGVPGGKPQYYEDFAPRGLSNGASSHGSSNSRPTITIQ